MHNEGIMEGRWVRLRSLREHEDIPLLFDWRNDVDRLPLWSMARSICSQHQFEDEWTHRLREHFHCVAMIEKREQESPMAVGFSYSYDASLVDGHVFLCTYLDPVRARRGHGLEATALFLQYLFAFYPLRKCYADIFSYNRLSLDTCRHAGFEVEGLFREHRYFDGRYWDTYRLALHRAQWEARGPKLLSRLARRDHDAPEGERPVGPMQKSGNVATSSCALVGNTPSSSNERDLVAS